MSLSAGTRLGPYEIIAAIGAGGMGEVYQARDTNLGRDVAIKMLPEAFATDPDGRGRIPVITDSGYRRGSDILKALALGANAVMLGRATRWALAAFGVPGVQRLLEIMQRELVQAAAAAGRTTLPPIDKSIVRTRFV